MTPTHSDLAPSIAVALGRAGITTVGVNYVHESDGHRWANLEIGGASVSVFDTVMFVASYGEFDVDDDDIRAFALVRAVLAGSTPARLAVEAGVAFEVGAMLTEVIRRGWHADLTIETDPTWCIAEVWDHELREPPYGAGDIDPAEALAQAILQALAAQPDPRGEG